MASAWSHGREAATRLSALVVVLAVATTPATALRAVSSYAGSTTPTTRAAAVVSSPETAASPSSAPTSGPDQSTSFRTVDVALGGERDYPIYIGPGLLDSDTWPRHVRGQKCLVVTNEVVASCGYVEPTVRALERAGKTVSTLVLPDGESTKTMDTLNRVLDVALEQKLDRKSTFVALGGGVIGDLVGFAAAIYVRGIDFVQIPTTLMAMVDSSVGGKTAVNHARGKNMIGAFYQPRCVVADTATLETLPRREFASGVAEIVKYGLIRDAALFEWLEADDAVESLRTDGAMLAEAIERSCENKAAVVAGDEQERSGLRATLNLGHTFGHAIETRSGYGTYFHGEAVAAGTAMAARLSRKLGWIDESVETRAVELLKRADLPVDLALMLDRTAERRPTVEELLDIMSLDKKVADGQLRLILLKGALGSCVFTADFDPALLRDTIEEFLLEGPQ